VLETRAPIAHTRPVAFAQVTPATLLFAPRFDAPLIAIMFEARILLRTPVTALLLPIPTVLVVRSRTFARTWLIRPLLVEAVAILRRALLIHLPLQILLPAIAIELLLTLLVLLTLLTLFATLTVELLLPLLIELALLVLFTPLAVLLQ
jgi:hypothetical protein